MRWTVVLPTHDGAATVGFAIESALAQEDADFELLIIGDGTDDATRSVIRSYSDPRVLFFDNAKGEGFGYAHRRAALESARGDYVAFLSDDDLWSPRHLLDLGRMLDDGFALAYSRPLWCTPSGYLVALPFVLGDPTAAEAFAVSNYIPSVAVASTMAAITAAGGWPVDVALAADWTLWRRILDLPGAAAASHPHATAVHFRSRRRDFDHPAVAAILALPDLPRWWPSAAQVEAVADGSVIRVNQQQIVAAKLSQPEWVTSLDAAIGFVDLHLAFYGIGVAGELQTFQSVRDQLAEVTSSRSWRVTRPLRSLLGLARRLRPDAGSS